MGATPTRLRRWLVPALLLLIITLFLLAGRQALAVTAPRPAAAVGTIYLPYTGKPWPPQIELVPFTVGFDNISITTIAHAGDDRLFVGNREGKVLSLIHISEPTRPY